MDFSFTEEQQMLQDSIRRYLASDYPLEHRAKTIAGEEGWSADTWRALADLGLLALDIDEADGGIGAGPVGTMLVSQATGAGLLLEPFHSSAVLATRVVSLLARGEQRATLLGALAGAGPSRAPPLPRPMATAGACMDARPACTTRQWRAGCW